MLIKVTRGVFKNLCQTSKMELFAKIVESRYLFFQKHYLRVLRGVWMNLKLQPMKKWKVSILVNSYIWKIYLKNFWRSDYIFLDIGTLNSQSTYELLVSVPVDTGCKLNVHKTFRRRPGRLLNVLCTFNVRPVSTGVLQYFSLYRLEASIFLRAIVLQTYSPAECINSPMYRVESPTSLL